MLSKSANLQSATLKQHDLIFEYFSKLLAEHVRTAIFNF